MFVVSIADTDIASSAGPAWIVTEPAVTGTAPPEVIVPTGAVSSSAVRDTPAEEAIKETPVAPTTTQGGRPAVSASIPVGAPVESAIIGGLKESLVKASQFELRLRELASEAELVKSNMHVSTYVSFPTHWVSEWPLGVLLLFFGHFLVHPLGVAPKAPSNIWKLFGVF